MAPSTIDTSLLDAANNWLARLEAASKAGDVEAFVDEFLPDGWLRDILCFSWDLKSLSGKDSILRHLSEPSLASPADTSTDACPKQTRFAHRNLHSFGLDHKTTMPNPRPGHAPDGEQGGSEVEGTFTFSVSHPPAHGKGYFHLVKVPLAQNGSSRPTADSTTQFTWKASLAMMTITDLQGYEERRERELGVYSEYEPGVRKTWDELRAEEIKSIEEDPTVLIIGAGHVGLMCAARFRRLGLKTMIIERLPRVGDNWRNRYNNLTLHTPTGYSTMLYHPQSTNYLKYMPKNKIASVLESYAETHDIHVWLNTTFLPGSTYDSNTGRWSVEVEKKSADTPSMTERVTLRPKYLVITAGLGAPRIPNIKGLKEGVFKGPVYHSTAHTDAKTFRGKRAVVIGAGNTAADLCQDFATHGASEITMIQRSNSCVCSSKVVDEIYLRMYNEREGSLPYAAEDIDFVMQSMPPKLLLQIAAAPKVGLTVMAKEADKDLLEGLARAGFSLTWSARPGGPEVGLVGFLIERHNAGSLIDVGVGKLIIDGTVKVKSGVEISEVVEDGLVFEDGTKLEADVIVLGTGYQAIIDSTKTFFGPDIAAKLPAQILGLDPGPEGEVSGAMRPTGHPALWVMAADFMASRFFSKHLGLQILAKEHGLYE